MPATTRPTPEQFASATWEEIEPLFVALVDVPLEASDPAAIETWLEAWNALDVAVKEASVMAENRYAADVTDPAREEAALRFSSRIDPRVQEYRVRLAQKLLDTGYTREDIETPLRNYRADARIFRAENIPLRQQLVELQARYSKLTGSMSVEWQGERVPVSRLNRFLQDPDRSVRETAWRAQFAPYVELADTFDDLFDQQIELRQRIARNAGFANYRDYAFVERYRFDYTPDDCARFHAGVQETWVPLLRRRWERQRQQLGVATLRPWDLNVDPAGREPVRPYRDIDDLHAKAERIFDRISPDFGRSYRVMRANNLLDLEARPGKRPGGFCNPLPYSRSAFILMNAAETALDVQILIHEAGHAFHTFEAAAQQPLEMQNIYGEEIAEVASMAMELLADRYLHADQGGFFGDEDLRRHRIELFDHIATRSPYISVVDAYQHWVYTDPAGTDREARHARWLELMDTYQPGLDWSGLEAERKARWHRQLHIFLVPFYYIEYAIAQLGALQVWRNAREDWDTAIAQYRHALSLGGSKPLPELYAAAGARMVFDTEGLRELADLVEAELALLEG